MTIVATGGTMFEGLSGEMNMQEQLLDSFCRQNRFLTKIGGRTDSCLNDICCLPMQFSSLR